MKKVSAVILFFFTCLFGKAQTDTLQARIILIGDAGQLTNGRHPVVASIKDNMKLDKKTTIIFLGDNLYKEGLPDEQVLTYSSARAVLDSQVNIAKGTPAKVYFIPGNHDWEEYGEGGWNAIIRQQQYIDAISPENVKFHPEDGCPGPVMVNVSDDVIMVMIDSQWWLHLYDKPGIESDCPYKTKIEVLSELEDILSRNSKKLVILATHHPLRSYGIHGGYFTFKQHLFPLTDIRRNLYIPLPGIGSIYPIARGVFGTPQDLPHPAYVSMVKDIEKVVYGHPNTIFVAGHEHNQQLIKDSSYYYIVSGSGAKENRVSKRHNSLFASDTTGFATIEVSKNKNVNVSFYNVKDDQTTKSYSANLFNFSKLPERTLEDTLRVVYVPYNADSIRIAINPAYAKASGFKQFLNGKNYRDEWATPVTMKLFNLNKMGFTIVSLGGGKQTKSLRLKDKNNREWVLRTIDKDLEKLLPDDFRNTAAENYLSDFVSAAHPYAPLIVPTLAKAANIIVATPKLYFVPNDNALGIYRPIFANKVVMLEEREPTPDKADTKSTAKLLNKLIEDNDQHVEQPGVLQSRLLDFLLADWDRHFDQWRFGETDTGKGKLYYSIPRDRDQALAFSDGLFIKLASKNLLPFLKGFKKDIPGINWLAYWGRDFDRLFMNNLDEQAWKEALSTFQKSITDETIHKAVKNMPPEIYNLKGPLIEAKLKSRRDLLIKEGINYYKFLSKEVNVVGSNQKEYFRVSQAGKQLQVRVYKRTKAADSVSVMFDRKFDASTTKEIRFYGLNGDDRFEVDDDVSSKIRLRMIGGKGDDTFNIKGNVKNHLYDFVHQKNFIEQANKTKNEFEDDPNVNEYSPTGFQYDRVKFPNINLGYNVEDGLLMGLGFTRTTYGFRKEPYSTNQRFATFYAPASGSYKLDYKGDFTKVFGKSGLIVNADLVKPVLNNFFGLGNVTKYNPDLKLEFYRVRYNFLQAEALLSKRLMRGAILVGIGPHVYHYWNKLDDNAEKILSRPTAIGLDSFSIYQAKTYGGVKALAVINTLNNPLYPTRGVLINTQVSALAAINNAKPYTSFISDLTLYTPISEPGKVVSVIRLGGGHIFSKNYEYFQALNLGQNNFLRGFRKNRFSGNSLAYLSAEVRIKLFDTKSYILPGAFGLVVFNDVGRVWIRNEESKRWHNSSGGGIYYAAYNTVLISATAAFSREEKLMNFTIGSKFNLTF